MKKRFPSALYEAFEPALKLLARTVLVGEKKSPRRFLDAWTIDRTKVQFTVTFYKEHVEHEEPETDVGRVLGEGASRLAVGAQ